MKAIYLVKDFFKPKCIYTSLFEGSARAHRCTHEGAKDVLLRGYILDEPCTTEDWMECPLNPEAPRK